MDFSRITRYTDGKKVKEASTSGTVRVKAEPNMNRELGRATILAKIMWTPAQKYARGAFS